jgi:hypothetical protein
VHLVTVEIVSAGLTHMQSIGWVRQNHAARTVDVHRRACDRRNLREFLGGIEIAKSGYPKAGEQA